ncbi:hypothetical protein [Algoriphagus namhaensis]
MGWYLLFVIIFLLLVIILFIYNYFKREINFINKSNSKKLKELAELNNQLLLAKESTTELQLDLDAMKENLVLKENELSKLKKENEALRTLIEELNSKKETKSKEIIIERFPQEQKK